MTITPLHWVFFWGGCLVGWLALAGLNAAEAALIRWVIRLQVQSTVSKP